MRVGKLTSQELAEVIINKTTLKNKEVLQSAGLAEDCCALKSDNILLLTTDPITATGSNAGRLAIVVSSNDVAVSGGMPICCLLTVIAPTDASVADISAFMTEAGATAEKMGIDIIGGHTEFSEAVNKMVVSCTMIGTAKKIIKTGGAKAGDSIIMTKTAGIEATAILASDHSERLLAAGMKKKEIEEAKAFIDKISVMEEAAVAAKYEVSSMHDVTEGGVYGAVTELAEAAGLGATIYADCIKVAPVTAKICRILDVSPMRIIGSGSAIIVTAEPEKILSELKKNGVDAAVIGTMRKNKEVTAIGEGTAEKLSIEPDQLLSVK